MYVTRSTATLMYLAAFLLRVKINEF